ncbi:hypothetical protein KDM87_16770 [Undibacterium sp. FT147W]|jgi:hypothetical protein|uniref:Uncharacterized protein n=1 Tax=Undibacterium rivi TaxID=2828729 RepID=A0ABS5H5V1_9BURK|nr:hypothetical protein [Undibacterium rivi]MBR7794251.1 hypothetical protein [Undibacterium rivi]
MNVLKPWLPLITIVGLGSVIACYFMSDHYLRFTEEVQLASGELIAVDRKFKTEALGEIGGPGGWDAKFNSMVIIRPLRDGNPPIWQSEIGLIPILFDQDTGTKEWFVVTTFYMCDAWRKIGKPKLPYAEFRLRNGQWQQVDLSPQHIGRPANILTRISNKAELAYHTINTKIERMSAQGIAPRFNKITEEWVGCRN